MDARKIRLDCKTTSAVNPRAVFDEHNERLGRIAGRLTTCYAGYPNRDKIISLLSYWLYGYRCILACYGIEAAIRFCRSGFGSHVRFAYLHEYGIDTNLRRKMIAAGCLFGLAAGFMSAAYLPGGRVNSIYSKLLWRLTKFAVMGAPVAVREARKKEIVGALVECFDGYDAGVIEKSLHDGLPPVFTADQIRFPWKQALRVDCSALSFMEFCGYENLFLFDRRLHVTGRQHGGGYDVCSVDYWVHFEKQLCDEFIGWGMSRTNERQHKFSAHDRPAQSDRGVRRLIWVERARMPFLLYAMSPALYAQGVNKSVIDYVCDELRSVEGGFFSLPYPGLLRSDDYAGKRGDELAAGSRGGESVIRADDVLIFDSMGGSLIHYCIEHGISLVIVLGRGDIPQLSERAAEWLGVLRSAGLAFLDDEHGLLSRRLTEIIAERSGLPARVESYHLERFKDI